MRKIIRLLVFMVLVLCFSCEGKVLFVNCEECIENEPVDAVIKVTLRDIGELVRIEVYLGDLENNALYGIYEAYGPEYTVKTRLNQKYTFTATYVLDGNTYITIDSTIPQVKFEESQCEYPCYYTYNNTIDLRLKNTINNK